MAGCFTLEGAGRLVVGCFPAGTGLDTTLEEAGFITDPQRATLQRTVFDKVHDRGCSIQLGDIPVAADTTVQGIMEAVFDNAVIVAASTTS